MTENRISSELADYFGVDRAIGDFIPDLLADFFDLGGFPDQIVALVRSLGLHGPKARMLDLGCGKGAVSIALARDLGVETHGIDLMQDFVDEAVARAEAEHLSGLCAFEQGDLRFAPEHHRGYEAVLLISVGYLFGGITETVKRLRETIVPGGFMIIDDVYLKSDIPIDFPGYEFCNSREVTVSQLTALGDVIVKEHRIPLDETKAQNRRYMDFVDKRARQLSASLPEHAESFARFADKERREIEIIENRLVNVTWILKKE